MPPMRVGGVRAGGRMGATVCRAVAGDPELELVAAVDPHHAGIDLRRSPASTSRRAGRTHRRRPGPGRRRGGGRLHRASARPATTWPGAPPTGSTPWWARPGSTDDDLDELRPPVPVDRAGQLLRGAQLRHRRRAHDALRRAGRAVVRHGRDHRAAPRRQGRRPVGDRDADRRAHGGGVGRLGPATRPARGRGRRPGRRGARPASASTRSASGAWSPTRRSCSARPGRA